MTDKPDNVNWTEVGEVAEAFNNNVGDFLSQEGKKQLQISFLRRATGYEREMIQKYVLKDNTIAGKAVAGDASDEVVKSVDAAEAFAAIGKRLGKTEELLEACMPADKLPGSDGVALLTGDKKHNFAELCVLRM